MKNALFAVTSQTIDTGSAWSVRREGSYFRGADKAVRAGGRGWWLELLLWPRQSPSRPAPGPGSDADSDSGTQSVAAAGRGQVSSAVRSQ